MRSQSKTPSWCNDIADWKYKNPKMHRPGHDDPPPDSDDFAFDVKCEHGRLGTNVAGRRRIPAKVRAISSTDVVTRANTRRPQNCSRRYS